MVMKKNVGAADRYIRYLIGLAFFLNIFSLEPSKFGTFVLIALGCIAWFTAYTQYCAVYDLLKINTMYEKKEKPAEPAQQPHGH